MSLQVLYEDNHLIAVFKPAGVLTQGDQSGDVCLMDEVKKYLKDKYSKPGNVFLGLIHRLDRNVSGIVLLAKKSKGAARLSAQFRNHTITKTYYALVTGYVKQQNAELKNFLLKNTRTNKVEIVKDKVPGADFAELSYEIVRQNKDFSLLKIILKTGRSHQIRAQLSFIGHPIVGDIKYGSQKSLPDQEIALSATSLAFDLVPSCERKVLQINYPSHWNQYLS
ncbi:MAG TPA: RluA family pseudouridine synthase [bacterium]|nr:RluA family pseudouridine synthase [bacterium]